MKIEAADVDGLRPLLRAFADELLDAYLSRQATPPASDNGTMRMAYSESEAAGMLGVAVHVLREQRRLNHIEHCRGPGRRIMYTKCQIETYLRRTA